MSKLRIVLVVVDPDLGTPFKAKKDVALGPGGVTQHPDLYCKTWFKAGFRNEDVKRARAQNPRL